ncbi:MAG: hypothetical protein HYU28_04020 [Actinobacteria bacterium]|nr:hypothetical protein [Actinomycetota bacterium]
MPELDLDLEGRLYDLVPVLALPEGDGLPEVVAARIRMQRVPAALRPPRRGLRVVAVALTPMLAVFMLLVASSSVRGWLADRLDSDDGGPVEFAPPGPPGFAPLPFVTDAPEPPEALGPRLSVAAAATEVGFEVLVPTDAALGPPAFAHTGHELGDGIALGWEAVGELVSPDPLGTGMLLIEIPGGALAPPFVNTGPASVQSVTVGDAEALWVEGPHDYLGPPDPGVFVPEQTPSTLVWQLPGLTLRLESWLPKARAIAIAETIEADPAGRSVVL